MTQDFLAVLQSIAPWLVGVSIVSLVLVAIAVPIVVVALPANYFAQRERTPALLWARHPLLRLPLLVLKNAIALILIVIGVALLFLPGQGLLTIVVGVLLLDFPGKYHFERWLIYRPRTLHLFNRIRERAGKPSFETTDDDAIDAS
jgi:hypothetical protein